MATMNEQQKYLLQRVPNIYSVKYKEVVEPEAIRKARKLVSEWDKKQEKASNDHRKAMENRIKEAREAIYFQTPEKALAIIKKLEQEANI